MKQRISKSQIVFTRSGTDDLIVTNRHGSDVYLLLTPLRQGFVSTSVNGIELYKGVASPGMLRLIAPGETWSTQVVRGFPLLRLEIPGAIWRQLLTRRSLQKAGTAGPLIKPLSRAVPEVERLARVLVTSPELKESNEQLLSKGVTQSMLAFLLNNNEGDEPIFQKGTLSAHQLNQAIRFARQNLPGGLQLDDWAKAVGLQRRTFVRCFKRSTGMAPYTYFLHLRIDEVKRLLETTDEAIASIAQRVGFSSQSHLGIAFRRRVGLPPLEWRTRCSATARRTKNRTIPKEVSE